MLAGSYAPSGHAGQRWRQAAGLGVALAFGALPLLVASPAPLQDWPNHVAGAQITAGLLRADPAWTRFYALSGFLIPDAVVPLAIEAVHRLGIGVAAAAEIVLLATYASFVAGFCLLARALGAWSPLKPPLAVLLFYGNALLWGLVSYVLGLGLVMALAAAWLAVRASAARLAIAAAGAVLLLFTHVVAAAVWVVMLAGFDLHRLMHARARPLRRLAGSLSGAVALLVVAGLLAALPGDAGHDLQPGYPGHDAAAAALRKLLLFGRVLMGGSPLQDAAAVAALLGCGALVLLTGRRLAPAASWPTALLLLAALAAPERLGTGSLLDVRLVLAPLLLAAAAVRTAPNRLAGVAAWGLVLARTAIVAAQFAAAGQVFDSFRRAASAAPPGSLMLMAYGTSPLHLPWRQVWWPPIQSIATSVVFRQVFMPAIFANPSQQPLRLLPAYQGLTQPWDLTDAAHVRTTAAALATVCGSGAFARVFLTELYPGPTAAALSGPAVIAARADFLLLDACRLPR